MLQSAANIAFWRRAWRDGAQTLDRSGCLKQMCVSMIAHDNFVARGAERVVFGAR